MNIPGIIKCPLKGPLAIGNGAETVEGSFIAFRRVVMPDREALTVRLELAEIDVTVTGKTRDGFNATVRLQQEYPSL